MKRFGANFMDPARPYYDKKWLEKTGLANNAINTPVAWELYDLRNDPNELRNVYNDPTYSETIASLKAEMQRQRELYDETDANFPHLQKIIDKHWD